MVRTPKTKNFFNFQYLFKVYKWFLIGGRFICIRIVHFNDCLKQISGCVQDYSGMLGDLWHRANPGVIDMISQSHSRSGAEEYWLLSLVKWIVNTTWSESVSLHRLPLAQNTSIPGVSLPSLHSSTQHTAPGICSAHLSQQETQFTLYTFPMITIQ